MSSWWGTAFFVVGDFLKIDELETELPSLFHIVSSTDRVGGGMVAEVLQNYGGEVAVMEMIAQYPSLIFNGVQIHEQAFTGDNYWVFEGKDGITGWRELRFPDVEREMTGEEIEIEITRIDKKMAGLTTRRELFLQQRRNIDREAKKESDPTVDRQNRSDEVAALVEKIRDKQRRGYDAPVLMPVDPSEQSAN